MSDNTKRRAQRLREFERQAAEWQHHIGPWLALQQAPAQHDVAGQPPTAQSYVTPLVRATAERLGVDLRQVKGTGPCGRIRPTDVRLASARGE